MNLHGDLAESWDLRDPLTYVFHLRRGIRFHDGRPLTATDVKATFDFILNPANRSPKRGGFRMLTSIEALDDATVIFHLKEPYASFTGNLIPSAVGIVPANAAADFSRHPIGSGPSASSVRRKTKKSSWNATRIIFVVFRQSRACASALSRMPLSARWNSAKAPPISKSVPSHPIWFPFSRDRTVFPLPSAPAATSSI
jgi:hypothetical protein